MSLLNCLVAAVPARERVITCEELFELTETVPEAAVGVCAGVPRRPVGAPAVGRPLRGAGGVIGLSSPTGYLPRSLPSAAVMAGCSDSAVTGS
jgi:hypothetical protein